MRVVEPGHVYEIHNVDDPDGGVQQIVFVRRRGDDGKLLEEKDRHPGILIQELYRVSIDRLLYLAAELPCAEDIEDINALRDCLRRIETRAARRSIEKLPMPEMQDVCGRCHHILCLCDHPSRLEHGIER